MGALQESRFALIIGVILLVGILAAFFLMQNNTNYTSFSSDLKSTYATTEASASTTKTLRDVATTDGTTFRQMKNNQLFGYSLSGSADQISLFDNYAGPTATLATSGATAPTGKMGITFLLSDDSSNVKNADGTSTGTGTLGGLNNLNIAGTISTDPVAKGWNLESGGYIAYTFSSEAIATDVLNNYIPTGTLVGPTTNADGKPGKRTIVAPFNAR